MSEPVRTDYGLKWGPLDVICIAHHKPRADREYYVIQVVTDDRVADIYVSKTGRSLRVFRDGKELT